MKAIVTAKRHDTRFFLTSEGLASDIPSRARTFNYSYDAQHAADLENTDSDLWHGLRWEAAYMLHDGSIALGDICPQPEASTTAKALTQEDQEERDAATAEWFEEIDRKWLAARNL